MNANLTLSEIVTIALIILIVFGPQRLPEMARKAGEILGKLRAAAASVRDEFSAEYDEIAKPLTDLDSEIKAAKSDLKDSVPKLDSLTDGLDGDKKVSDSSGNGGATAAGGGGNGAVDSFEAELAAARQEAEAELANESGQEDQEEPGDADAEPPASTAEVEVDESESA